MKANTKQPRVFVGWQAIVSKEELVAGSWIFLASFFVGICFWEIVL